MREITVTNALQKKYTYQCIAPRGKKFHPDFKPQLTPQEMLELGVFDGVYLTRDEKEFPKAWFKKAKLSPDGIPRADLNYFKIHASQTRGVWHAKGWIHADDPRGWFEWYCRYYLGRRHADDERQIRRWRAMARHVAQVVGNCMKGDETCRRRQRQALLHWAYDSRRL